MNRRSGLARLGPAAALSLAAATGCGPPASAPGAAGDRQAIRAAGDAFMVSYADPDSAVTFFTDDAHLMPPGGFAVVGRAALLDHLRQGNDAGPWDPSVSRDSIFVSGDVAIERGRYEMSGTTDGGPFTARGRYVIHWAREGERWRIRTYLANAESMP